MIPQRARWLRWTVIPLALLVAALLMHLTQARQTGNDAGNAGPSRVPVTTAAVPLNPDDLSQRAVGRFAYAGGLELTTTGVRFGGLSDLDLRADGELLSVADEGRWVSARLTLDERGRLIGLGDLVTEPLHGTDGEPLREKVEADAEGVAWLPNGDRLVSFERQHRIWRYPADGGSPVDVPTPPTKDLPLNSGLEGLSAAEPLGAGAYLVGSEGGTVWLCRLTAACRETRLGRFVPQDFSLTGIAVSADGAVIALATRAFEPLRGVRVRVLLLPRAGLDDPAAEPLDELRLEAPLTRDNVEGIALLPHATGLRLYLLSDNNFSDTQHTYLLAFDWSAT